MKNNAVENSYRDDEISLIEILLVLWACKATLLGGLLIGFLLGFLASSAIKPNYSAVARLSPALSSDISSLNIVVPDGISNFPAYEGKDIFQLLVRNTEGSDDLLRQFVDENQLLVAEVIGQESDSLEKQFSFIRKACSLKREKNKGGTVNFICEGSNPEKLADLVNQYVAFCQSFVIKRLKEDRQELVLEQKQRLQGIIDIRTSVAKDARQDRIAELTEALVVAKALGMEMPSQTATGKGENVLSVTTRETPLYLNGVVALDAERKALLGRKSDEAFASGLRELQAEVAYLNSVKPIKESVRLASISWAVTPWDKKGPSKVIIIAVGGLLGFMLATVFVLLRNAIREYKEGQT